MSKSRPVIIPLLCVLQHKSELLAIPDMVESEVDVT